MDAMTVLLGIVAEKLSHVFVAQQLILFGKEGMDVVQWAQQAKTTQLLTDWTDDTDAATI